MRQFETHVDGLWFRGRIDESHMIWVAVGGTYVPHAGQVSTESLLAYLAAVPSESWSADGLVEFQQVDYEGD